MKRRDFLKIAGVTLSSLIPGGCARIGEVTNPCATQNVSYTRKYNLKRIQYKGSVFEGAAIPEGSKFQVNIFGQGNFTVLQSDIKVKASAMACDGSIQRSQKSFVDKKTGSTRRYVEARSILIESPFPFVPPIYSSTSFVDSDVDGPNQRVTRHSPMREPERGYIQGCFPKLTMEGKDPRVKGLSRDTYFENKRLLKNAIFDPLSITYFIEKHKNLAELDGIQIMMTFGKRIRVCQLEVVARERGYIVSARPCKHDTKTGKLFLEPAMVRCFVLGNMLKTLEVMVGDVHINGSLVE